MTDTAALIDNYIATWNETDPQRRRELVTRTWADDASYVDPLMSSEGPDGIDAMIANVQEQYPDHRFELAAGPDAHNDRVRFSWHLVPTGGEPIALGIDFATLSEDGRLREVTGFLERVS
jgi:hypothetical protein